MKIKNGVQLQSQVTRPY